MNIMVFSCLGLSWISHEGLRRWLYTRVALTVFRCFYRCFSAHINFHNPENRPRTDGICVANHTSPIDVVILSVDRPYALVPKKILFTIKEKHFFCRLVNLTQDLWVLSKRAFLEQQLTYGFRGQRLKTDSKWLEGEHSNLSKSRHLVLNVAD